MMELSGPGSSASHYELVTSSSFKTFANVQGSTDDSLITALVNSVNRAAYKELGCRFILSTGVQYDQLLDGPTEISLWLPNRPVVSIASIEAVRMTGNSTFEVTKTYATTDYQVNLRAGELVPVTFFYWPSGKNSIRVRYEAGYTSVPPDLTEALHSWLMVKYQRIKGGRLDALSIAKETEATTFTVSDMPGGCSRILGTYKYWENNLV